MLFKKDKEDKYYRLKSVNTFAWGRFMSNTKRFRKVFDRQEVNYVSVALEFYNKLFDEKDWDTELTFKVFSLHGDNKAKELCSETKNYTVKKDNNVALYDFGWGHDEYGKYWNEGDYLWEVYINEELVGTSKFHIEDVGSVSESENPYFDVVSIKTYQAPYGDLNEDQRVYLKQFDHKDTRYIMTEFKFINKLAEEWLCELFFNYYDDTGILIGVADNLGYITPNIGPGEQFTITGGWGNADGNTWINDNYRIEVVFMNTVVAVIPFRVGEKEIVRVSDYEALINEDVSEFYGNRNVSDNIVNETKEHQSTDESSKPENTNSEPDSDASTPDSDVEIEIDNRPLKEILADLDSLVGLREIKIKVREYVDYVSYLQYREQEGLEEEEAINLHSVFTGNPGTGKTTVIKLLGKIYHAMGLLSKGHVHAVESNDLISAYVRQTGKMTREAIEKARGGILLIDEAYMLYKDNAPSDFGPEAVATLITEMSDGPGDLAIMVAGYPKEMESFINSNPGLKSRFRGHFHFEDYTPDELLEIGKYAAKKKNVKLSDKALSGLKKVVTDAYRKRDRTFGNARLVHAMIDEAKINLGIRLVRNYDPDELSKETLSLIEVQDINALSEGKTREQLTLDVDTALLEEAQSELNALTGLKSIKQEVKELVRLTKYYREMNRDILKAFSMHSVFLGNPGTGKTTVARILGKVFKALGLLERGHLVDADGSDLIAGFVGQSALKTKELIIKAMGGILFIDEAYAITEGASRSGGNDFGKKAIAALIKEMEDHRGEFAVIVAGYPENMKNFIEANPGIKSRFDQTFSFEDFTEEELWGITLSMFAEHNIKPDKNAENHLKVFISHLYQNRNKFFGNARSIRKLVVKAYRNHELRMADLPKSKRTPAVLSTLTIADVEQFEPDKEKLEPTPIGYKFSG